MKRTCPPPANWHEIQAGDRVRYQNESMLVEVEDTIVARSCGMLITVGGQEILPTHYILRLGAKTKRPREACPPALPRKGSPLWLPPHATPHPRNRS